WRVSWVVPLVRDGQRQRAYEIRVSTGDPRDESGPLTWTSGRVESSRSSRVEVPVPLRDGDRFLWTVRIWDERGEPSPWAEPGTVECGPRTRGDLSGRWIKVPAG